MVLATRPISWRTEPSRSLVPGLPWKYLLATMLVAVCDQFFGTSTFSWRKMVTPFSFPISAVRFSHSTASNGEILPSVKKRSNFNPVAFTLVSVAWPSMTGFTVAAILFLPAPGSSLDAEEPSYFTPSLERRCCAFYLVSFDSVTIRRACGSIAGFLSVQHKKKRPILLYRPPNVKKLAIDRLLPTGQTACPPPARY